jgi:hypothetical protein
LAALEAASNWTRRASICLPSASEDAAKSFSFHFDAALAAGPLEGGLKLCAGQPCASRWSGGEAEEFVSLGPAQTLLPWFHGCQGSGVVLTQQRTELVGDLLAVPDGVLLGTSERCDGSSQFAVLGQRPVGVHVRA